MEQLDLKTLHFLLSKMQEQARWIRRDPFPMVCTATKADAVEEVARYISKLIAENS